MEILLFVGKNLTLCAKVHCISGVVTGKYISWPKLARWPKLAFIITTVFCKPTFEEIDDKNSKK